MIPAEDFIRPRAKRVLRVLVVGAQPSSPSVKAELARMGAGAAYTVDGMVAPAARAVLKAKPVDVVLVVGPLWTPGPAMASQRTAVGIEAVRFLAGGFPVRWLRGETCTPLAAMPAPGDA